MKKIIIAALALAAAGFCGYTGNLVPTQVGIVEGCGTDAGTTAVAIQLPGYTYQFLVKSSQPFFGVANSYAQQAAADGRYLNLEFDASHGSYHYKYNGGCTYPEFYPVNSVTLSR